MTRGIEDNCSFWTANTEGQEFGRRIKRGGGQKKVTTPPPIMSGCVCSVWLKQKINLYIHTYIFEYVDLETMQMKSI